MIEVNLQVNIPDEIYEKFLTELERDGFVFAKFGEYTLVLSMPDIEPIEDTCNEQIGQPFISSSILNPEHKEIRGMMKLPQAKIKNGKIMCKKCGHWIDIVGTKWQHMAVIITDSCGGGETPPTSEIKYREKCYYCDCIEPTPAEG